MTFQQDIRTGNLRLVQQYIVNKGFGIAKMTVLIKFDVIPQKIFPFQHDCRKIEKYTGINQFRHQGGSIYFITAVPAQNVILYRKPTNS